MEFLTGNLTPASVDSMMQFNTHGYDAERSNAEYERHQQDIARALADTLAKSAAFDAEHAPLADVIEIGAQHLSAPLTEEHIFSIAQ